MTIKFIQVWKAQSTRSRAGGWVDVFYVDDAAPLEYKQNTSLLRKAKRFIKSNGIKVSPGTSGKIVTFPEELTFRHNNRKYSATLETIHFYD